MSNMPGTMLKFTGNISGLSLFLGATKSFERIATPLGKGVGRPSQTGAWKIIVIQAVYK